MRSRDRRARAGFTLIEVLIVMVLIGILSGIALPPFRNLTFKADAARVVSDMTTVRGGSSSTWPAASPSPSRRIGAWRPQTSASTSTR